MSDEYKWKDLVNFKMDEDIHGKGIIMGIAQTDVALIGKTYIVKVIMCTGPVKIPNKTYKFDTIAIPEIFLECGQ